MSTSAARRPPAKPTPPDEIVLTMSVRTASVLLTVLNAVKNAGGFAHTHVVDIRRALHDGAAVCAASDVGLVSDATTGLSVYGSR